MRKTYKEKLRPTPAQEAALGVVLFTMLVMLHAMRYALRHGTPPPLASDYDKVRR